MVTEGQGRVRTEPHQYQFTFTTSTEGDGVAFIAMEYVAGKTLGEMIGRKAMHVAEVLSYRVQIAVALAN